MLQTLKKRAIIELSAVMFDILKLAEEQTNEEIVQVLKTTYAEDEIYEAFEGFAEFEKEGLLFNRGKKSRGDHLSRSRSAAVACCDTGYQC